MQFKKFARFDPHALPLSDEDLAKRTRQVTRRAAWHDTLRVEHVRFRPCKLPRDERETGPHRAAKYRLRLADLLAAGKRPDVF